MLPLLVFVTVLYDPQFVFGAIDPNCTKSDCECCVDKMCSRGHYFDNECTKGCIDGHKGARCYKLCNFNCKTCNANIDTCEACYDDYFLDSHKHCIQCPSNCKTCSSSINCNSCKGGFENREGSTTCEFSFCPATCICNKSNCIECTSGYFDTRKLCINKCPKACVTCSSLRVCDACLDGYYNEKQIVNDNANMLFNCTHKCRDTCVRCSSHDQCHACTSYFKGNTCNECLAGKYGELCEKPCAKHCKNRVCDRLSGNCSEGCVTDNITGENCNTCISGKYGEICKETCPDNCENNVCERKSGNCTDGCVLNFGGTRCTECIIGKYGNICDLECPKQCLDTLCNKQSGNCSHCIGNYDGAKCNLCKPGLYGSECNQNCSRNCMNGTCNKSDGNCTLGCTNNFTGDKCCIESKHCLKCISNLECQKCTSGYFGQLCDKSCPSNCKKTCGFEHGVCDECEIDLYGLFCNFTCSDHCNISQDSDRSRCASLDGACSFGCKDGYFGPTCNDTCSSYCIDDVCTKEAGVCLKGCKAAIDDTNCGVKDDESPAPQNIVGPVVGGTIALLVVIAGSIIAVLFYKRCHKRQDASESSSTNVKKSSKKKTELTQTVEGGYINANISGNKQRENSKNMREEDVDVEAVVVDEQEDENIDEATDYYNINPDHWRINVADLFLYVTKEHVELFAKDFQNLPTPDDLSEVCKVAKKPENIALNRYNGIYPFDHSRVTIPGQSRFFINACYIDGYNRKKAYIASFGPTEKTTEKFTTFWRMVWHENTEIVVMLTNLREASGMKCEQYWPEKGEEHYGHVKVEFRSVEVFAEYTVRIFTISKGKERRNLTHLHYTAWPDKGVPSEVTSLVEFRQRVKAVPIVLDGPVVVHCSAGVGRTGTYIALDILTNEGETEGSVKVFNCVSKMREQRVNMVQTAEQYKYLHKALVHALTFECEAIIAEEVQSLAFEADDMFNRMFRTLQHEVDKEKGYEVAAREENRKAHADKSRRHSDVPGDRGRVRLFLRRKTGNHDYINAVFINSFKIKNLFIAAQSPLSGTVEDFLCMIYQQDCSCVVALESLQQPFKQNDVGEYLPADNETYRCGSFTVTSSKCETKPQYIVKKLSIQNAEKREDKTVYHFQYTKWGKVQNVADSARDFVHFVKEVEKYVNERAEDTPNIVVHCLNGYERSGLFCVVYTLLEKLEAERQVSVVNIIRRVRAQRRRSVSNTEQLKFCYQCISAYLESYSTYSNFAT